MNISVNGESLEIQESVSVLQWLEKQKVVLAITVLEYNGEILPRECWTDTRLQHGDRLEVLTFMGGGC
ncbi:MAG TPA: sulfur carrier protein ThiS [Verrucomicrobiae bacterium]|nr:sulfur carrier protein ThiS [Verrucomicrobiae bacterium]